MFREITRQIKDRVKQMKNIRSIQTMDTDLLKSFLIIIIITLLSYEATDLFYKIISIPLSKQTAAIKGTGGSEAKDNRERPQLQDYSIIIERNLFLTTLKTAGGNESLGGIFDSDQKNADFDLKGTVACNSSFGFIVLEERGTRKQKLYRLGDKIGSSKLTKITPNPATFKNVERETTLKIKETMEGSLLPNSPAADKSASPARAPVFSKKTGNENINQLESIMNQAVLRPFMNKGVREGYIISNIAANSLYEKAGLQNGDIIIDVNNNQMQNANDILQVLNSMQSGGNMELNIKRNGKAETLNYSFN
jgi:general secretion pathway protein C